MNQAKSAIIVFILIAVCQTPSDWGQNNSDYRLAKLESAVQKHPESSQAHYELGVAYLESEEESNYPKAIEALKQAVQIKPDFAEAHCKLGEAQMDNKEGAMEEYKALRKLPKAGFPGCVTPLWFDEELLFRVNK